MLVIRDARELARAAHRLGRPGGLGGVLVPTMGALHAGHFALIERGRELAARLGEPAGCVVSIFVNPTQFSERADFDHYPRTLDEDLARCERHGVSIVFAPTEEVIYPPDEVVPVPPLPDVAHRPGLEDRFRPGHFAGVCQVVLRLFHLLQPRAAMFGEKDWQQLQVVRAMTLQQQLSIDIVAVGTVREPDGLALSSRNVRLSAGERVQALALSQALQRAAECPFPDQAEAEMAATIAAAGLTPDYAVIRDATTLEPVEPSRQRDCRALVAARVGPVRLLDNAPWPAPASAGRMAQGP